MQTQILKYDVARTALAEANSIDDVKVLADKTEALQHYAKQIHDTDMEIWLAEIKIRAKRKLGELTKEIPKSEPKNQYSADGSVATSKKQQLDNAGISQREASRCEKLAAIPDNDFDAIFDKAKESNKPVTYSEVEKAVTNNTHVSNNSGENEWYTPPEFLNSAIEVMGGIDLDPASSEKANENVCAEVFYTEKDDGLSKDWSGRVWMNPPYAQPLMNQFAEKLCDSLGDVTQAIVLVNNATETNWFQSMASKCTAICFPSKRIKFIDKTGERTGAPLQGQAFLYFGDNVESFAYEFSQHGLVVIHEL